jgi:MFS family permease
MSGFALFAERRFEYGGHPFGPREIGYVFGYAGLLGIIVQGRLIARMVKRFGESSLLTSGLLALMIGYTALGVATSVPALIIVVTVAAYGTGVTRPAITSLITHEANRAEQGVVLGVTQSLMPLAAIVSPIVAGLLIERGLLAQWAWVAAAVAAIGLMPALPVPRYTPTGTV